MKKYLIIGAGPAGLATAVALKAAQIPFEIIDSGNKVGGIWDINRVDSPMYESAHFISSKTLSGFKNFPMPDSYPDYPKHNLVQAYIESYARHHQLEQYCRFNTTVVQVKAVNQMWEVTCDDQRTQCYQGIICATGITWHCNMPEIEGRFDGELIHSLQYKSSDIFSGKRALILGAGNSGCDIACDAAKVASRAFISTRRGYYFIPKYTFGMPSDVFKEKFKSPFQKIDTRVSQFLLNKVLVGKLSNYGLPQPDHPLFASHPIMNSRLLHFWAMEIYKPSPMLQHLKARKFSSEMGVGRRLISS